jgi:hypothetical protein
MVNSSLVLKILPHVPQVNLTILSLITGGGGAGGFGGEGGMSGGGGVIVSLVGVCLGFLSYGQSGLVKIFTYGKRLCGFHKRL